MNICFPITECKGLNSVIAPLLDSAAIFLVISPDRRIVARLPNQNRIVRHDAAQLIKELNSLNAGIIIAREIERETFLYLVEKGYHILHATEVSVGENLDRYLKDELVEVDIQNQPEEPEDIDYEFGCGF